MLAFDSKIQSEGKRKDRGTEPEREGREGGGEVKGCREAWQEMKCVIWEKRWAEEGGGTGLFSPLCTALQSDLSTVLLDVAVSISCVYITIEMHKTKISLTPKFPPKTP